MQLRALVDSKNRWTKIALGSIYTLAVTMFGSLLFLWWSGELARHKGGNYFLLALSLFIFFLLAMIWFSQLKVTEVFETMMMNQRILSEIAEDQKEMFQNFHLLDCNGYDVDGVLKYYKRYGLQEKYELELFRIRRKMRKICSDPTADPDAKKKAQDAHDKIATLATWKRVAHLEDPKQEETAPSELAGQPEEGAETIFFT